MFPAPVLNHNFTYLSGKQLREFLSSPLQGVVYFSTRLTTSHTFFSNFIYFVVRLQVGPLLLMNFGYQAEGSRSPSSSLIQSHSLVSSRNLITFRTSEDQRYFSKPQSQARKGKQNIRHLCACRNCGMHPPANLSMVRSRTDAIDL